MFTTVHFNSSLIDQLQAVRTDTWLSRYVCIAKSLKYCNVHLSIILHIIGVMISSLLLQVLGYYTLLAEIIIISNFEDATKSKLKTKIPK